MSAGTQTQSRPFDLQWLDPNVGTANPLNWRSHPPNQTAALESLIYNDPDVGWAAVALLNERRVEDGWTEAEAFPTFIDGHDRRLLAIKHGGLLPTIVGHWSPVGEKKILATLDPIAALATTEKAQLDALLKEITPSDAAVNAMLSELAESNGLYFGEQSQPKQEDEGKAAELVDRAAELQAKWQVERGQIFEVGRHRLMCGDSLNPFDRSELLELGVVHMLWSDPPYGLGGYSGRGDTLTPVAGDELDGDSIRQFFRVGTAREMYICCEFKTYEHLLATRGTPRSLIVWAKNVFGMGRGYRRQQIRLSVASKFRLNQPC